MNEIGLDPGIDHLYAVKTIKQVHEEGGKVHLHAFHVRLSNSFLIVVVYLLQKHPIILWDINSAGALVVCYWL
jgi:hypothetical protein